MSDKKINRFSNVELLDAIKNGSSKSAIDNAKTELERRNLTKEELNIAETEYLKFLEFKEKRKDQPLTREEWFSFFFLPFITPSPRWRNDHFSDSEYKRFEKYGFDKKLKQASEVKMLGVLFWFVIIMLILIISEYIG